MSAIDRLLEHAEGALSDDTPRLTKACSALGGALAQDLLALLWARNGFLAFDAALHVFPITSEVDTLGLVQWNSKTMWRATYCGLADDALFFAQDLFGGQFGITNDNVFRFDPETGSREVMASSIEGWVTQILEDPGSETGWPLALKWRRRFGPIDAVHRLIPKQPFVLGGAFSVANLHRVTSRKAMTFYGDLATQLRNVPEGSQISLRVVE